jgi:hypothetical protein
VGRRRQPRRGNRQGYTTQEQRAAAEIAALLVEGATVAAIAGVLLPLLPRAVLADTSLAVEAAKGTPAGQPSTPTDGWWRPSSRRGPGRRA